MKPTLKEALGFARSIVTGKMFALAGIPLLLLAVGMGFLSLFRFALAEQTLETRAQYIFELAQTAFPGAEIERVPSDDGLLTFCAFDSDSTAGALAAFCDERGYAAVAWSADGQPVFERSDLPGGPARDAALNAARIAAIELAALKRGDSQ